MGYADKLSAASKTQGVESHLASKSPDRQSSEGQPAVLITDFQTWSQNHVLHEEIFGPATLLVRCSSRDELLSAAQQFDGSLTATIHTTQEELAGYMDLVDQLSCMAGRLVMNGFPTGVEVGSAMHHGGPYPATTDAKFTSVGTTAIYRFAKPVCYQNFPESLLPPELQDANPRGIWRTVNGKLTREKL